MGALFSCDVATADATATICCRGEFAFGVSDPIYDALAQVRPEVTSLVVDLQAVTFVDSTGVRALLAARALMSRQDGKVTLRDASNQISRVLEILGLSDAFAFEWTDS